MLCGPKRTQTSPVDGVIQVQTVILRGAGGKQIKRDNQRAGS